MSWDEELQRLRELRNEPTTSMRRGQALTVVINALSTSFPCGYDEPSIATGTNGGCESCDSDGRTIHWDGNCLGSRTEALGIAAAIIRCALELPEDDE